MSPRVRATRTSSKRRRPARVPAAVAALRAPRGRGCSGQAPQASSGLRAPQASPTKTAMLMQMAMMAPSRACFMSTPFEGLDDVPGREEREAERDDFDGPERDAEGGEREQDHRDQDQDGPDRDVSAQHQRTSGARPINRRVFA